MSGGLCCQTVQGGAGEGQVQGGPRESCPSWASPRAYPGQGGGGRGEMMKPPFSLPLQLC